MATLFLSLPISLRPSLRLSRSLSLKLPSFSLKPSLPLPCLSSLRPVPATEDEVLEAIADSDGTSLPAVRTYENDSARLALVGAVSFEQALAAAAADGGDAAEQHVAAGMEAMVVETVFPGGPPDEHGTVSTRLFLPARKVKEKAKKFKRHLTEDFLSGSTSQTILAMTFRQVVLSQLWNFEMLLYRPGSERNMEELDNPREVPASFALNSSDDRVISVLGEVICRIALESTERRFIDYPWSISASSFFRWLQKSNRVISNDSAVILHKLFEDEIIASAQSLLATFQSQKANYRPLEARAKNSWWSLSTYSKLEKIGGPEFSAWVNEYVPAYKLQVDSNRFPDLKFEGWRQIAENRWEVLLTHSQMVDLANILDMYYEDAYTLPKKQLSCGATAKTTNLSSNKRTASLLKLFTVTVASGLLLVIVSILGQFHLPYLHNRKRFPGENRSLQSFNINDVQPIEATKVEEFCASIVHKIKDAFGWTGDVQKEKSMGAWIGEVPMYLRSFDQSGYVNGEITSLSSPFEESDEELKKSAQDVASYQVVMSADGRIIGFQPTSRVAVNQWAANPLAKELYGGRKLSPGIMEPRLKISCPDEVAVIELLMSTNLNSSFALARPSQ